MSKSKGAKPKQATQPIPAVIENSDFDLELCWCIHKLEDSLYSGKLNEREAERLRKSIHTLKSPNEVFIKKRILMKQLLGDYRDKMKKEAKQLEANAKPIKIEVPKGKTKSIFIRKCASANAAYNYKINKFLNDVGNCNISEEDMNAASTSKQEHTELPSSKPFRFAFNISEQDGKDATES